MEPASQINLEPVIQINSETVISVELTMPIMVILVYIWRVAGEGCDAVTELAVIVATADI